MRKIHLLTFRPTLWPPSPHTYKNFKIRKMEVFRFFSIRILNFARSIVFWVEKMTFSLFCGNFKNYPFWPKLTQIWPAETGWKKIFRQKFREKNLKFPILPLWTPLWLPSPHALKLKWRFFTFFAKKIKFYIFSFL